LPSLFSTGIVGVSIIVFFVFGLKRLQAEKAILKQAKLVVIKMFLRIIGSKLWNLEAFYTKKFAFVAVAIFGSKPLSLQSFKI
jgi:hypothetical protein